MGTWLEEIAWGLARPLGRVILVALVTLVSPGCDPWNRGGTAAEETETHRNELRVERSGRLPENPDRLVSLAPNVTETIFALGAGDRVVGVTKFCTHPEEATNLPSVGSFANPDFERILNRRPDLVLGVISGGSRSIFEKLRRTNVPYAFLEMSTVDETYAGIRRIGEYLGRKPSAGELVSEMQEEMARISERAKNRSKAAPRVVLVYGHDPVVAAGPGTFGHQLLIRSGAQNVLAEAETQYPRVDAEKLVELDPDRILDTAAETAARGEEYWKRFDMLRAVRDDAISVLPDPVVLRPGPRLPEALRRIARAVHGTSTPSGDPQREDSGESEGVGR